MHAGLGTPWLLVSGDFVRTGGMDRANHALAEYLALRGEEVHLVAYRADERLLRSGNVTLHAVRKPLNSYLLGRRHLDRAGRAWAARIASLGGHVVVNGGNCCFGDVNWVHYVHAAYSPPPAGSLPRRLLGAWKHHQSLAAERRAILSARLVIANSHLTRRDMVERLGADEARVKTVYLGTDPDEFRPATQAERVATRADEGWTSDRPVAVFVGAPGDRRKGLDTVLRAWRILRRRGGWDVLLAVIGRDTGLQSLREQLRREALDAHVTCVGFRQDVGRLVRSADLLVAPARYEPYGLSVHEALCSGVPAVVSASCGVCERLPFEARDLIVQDAGDAGELAVRLATWQEDQARYRALALDTSRTLRQWTWHCMAEEMVRLIRARPAASAAASAP